MSEVLEEVDNGLTNIARRVLNELLDRLVGITELFDNLTQEIELIAKQINACKRLAPNKESGLWRIAI